MSPLIGQPYSEGRKIALLPEHLVDQIKAGEVVERPSSLIKELVENAIDAGSTHIKIEIKGNGLDLIRIEDNGVGMTQNDLPLAFLRHATSKLHRFEDLYSLRSFGFRGEALASIASISRLTCVTTPKECPENGGKIEIHGGETIQHQVFKGAHAGSSFSIKDLFYNTPARLKFIKSKTSEKNALKRMVHSFLLAHPEVGFTVQWEDKEAEFFPPSGDDNTKRIEKVLFKKNEPLKKLIHLSNSYENYSIEGYISELSTKGHAGKHQFLFVNDRLIFDKPIHQAILRGMEKFWPEREYGHYVINLQVPLNELDINVHPNKTQIKFFQGNLVYSLIKAAIESALEKMMDKQPSTAAYTPRPVMGVDSGPGHYEKYENIDQFIDQKSGHLSHFSLGPEFELIRLNHDGGLYLVKKSSFLTQFLKEEFQKGFPFNDQKVTPLLIAEPVEAGLILEKYQLFFENMGIECKAVEKNLILIQSIPDFLSSLPLELLSPVLLQAQVIDRLESPDQLFETVLDFSHLTLTSHQWDILFKQVPLDCALERKDIVLFDEASINSLFK